MKILKKINTKVVYATFLTSVLTLFVTSSTYAQTIGVGGINADTEIGNVGSLEQAFFFVFNLLRYLGWAGVIIGVGLAIFGLIYKLLNEDNEKILETVRGYITKAVVIVLAGILLISAGFIVKVVGNLFGLDLGFDLQEGSSEF